MVMVYPPRSFTVYPAAVTPDPRIQSELNSDSSARDRIGDNIAKNHRLLRANHMPERPFASGTYSMYLHTCVILVSLCVHHRFVQIP